MYMYNNTSSTHKLKQINSALRFTDTNYHGCSQCLLYCEIVRTRLHRPLQFDKLVFFLFYFLLQNARVKFSSTGKYNQWLKGYPVEIIIL